MSQKPSAVKRKILGFYIPGHRTQLFSAAISFIYVAISVLAVDSAVAAYLMHFSWEGEQISSTQYSEFVSEFLKILAIYSVSIIAIFGFLMSYISLHLTHHFAGPTVQIQRAIQAMIEGDFSKRITLRETDELKALATSLNQLADKLSASSADRK